MKQSRSGYRLALLLIVALLFIQCRFTTEPAPVMATKIPADQPSQQITEISQSLYRLPDGAAAFLLDDDGRVFVSSMVGGMQAVQFRVQPGETFLSMENQIQMTPHFALVWQTLPAREGASLILSDGTVRFIDAPTLPGSLIQVFASPNGDRLFWLADVSPVAMNLIKPCEENPDCPGYIYELVSSDLLGQDAQTVTRIECGVRDFGLRIRFEGWNTDQTALRLLVYFAIPGGHYLPERGLVYEVDPGNGQVSTYGSLSTGALLSPDGMWLADASWNETGTEFEIQKLPEGAVLKPEVAFGAQTIVEQLRFSAGGEHLAWIAMDWDAAQNLPRAMALQVMKMNTTEIQTIALEVPGMAENGALDLPYLTAWLDENILVINQSGGSRLLDTRRMSSLPVQEVLPGSEGLYLVGLVSQKGALPSITSRVVLPTAGGLFLLDLNKNELEKVTGEAPAVVEVRGSMLAYSTTVKDRAGGTLHIFDGTSGQAKEISRLVSDEQRMNPDGEICTPEYEAARAPFVGQGLAWSPDGSQLAFISASQNSGAEVFIYSLADGDIRQLSDVSGQVYDLHWSPDGRFLTAFIADCFGTGAGFRMVGSWALDLNSNTQFEPVKLNPDEVEGLSFDGWLDGQTMLVSDWSSFCGARNVRKVDLLERSAEGLVPGCAAGLTLSADSRTAAFTVVDYASDDPAQTGFFLVSLEDGSTILQKEGLETAEIRYDASLDQFLVRSWEDEVLSFTPYGAAGSFSGTGELPVFSINANGWVASGMDGVWLQTVLDPAPRKMSDLQSNLAFWGPDGSLFYFAGDDAYGEFLDLYRADPPGYAPLKIAEGVFRPYSGFQPVWLE